MLKTISAALVAVSVLAAPAIAGTAGKTAQAPVNKTAQAPANKAAQAPAVKTEQGKAKALNANAKIDRHHKHQRKHISMVKTHAKPDVAVKHAKPAAKRS
ncbi:hypothetical protein J6524_19475 [Bradyrhizobium sp. WSM 1738]|uniref:His-rich protein BRANT n=1 Tax=Bradyrhizobium hereditatis TaxID=2821405 RepID=UPI001CE396D9|nr:hypothetical protein [Bradyrhizobium hereditatis]MCA6117039.1 hypothetical protein [Bradyrhizobium hereditatis]